MDWIGKLIGGGIGSVVEQVGNVVDQFHLSKEEKQKFKLQMEALLQQRDSEIEESLRSELQAKERILVAELTQGDSYTKRARPTVVYVGLGFIFINYCLAPLLGHLFGDGTIPTFNLPNGFWAGWSGIVATWSVGRTFEKRGGQNKIVAGITGASPRSSLLDDSTAKG